MGGPRSAPGSLTGQTIDGRFEVLSLLGTGAVGDVYLARHLSLDTTVALKTIKADLAPLHGEEKRFGREALALSRLDHPCIVRLIDFGRLPPPADFNYLVMEYVEGLDAQKVVDRGPLPPDVAVAVLRQVAAALSYAHAGGIVHRDLKPANILLPGVDERLPPPDQVRVKLVDFGLVRIITDETLTKLTADEQILGTPRFMAPEQCQCMDVGPPADVYALGGIGFLLLSGSPLFEAESVINLIVAHARTAPERLSQRCPQLSLPAELDELIYRCVAKAPDARPTADEVKAILDSLGPFESHTVSTRRPPPPASEALCATLVGSDVNRISAAIWADPLDPHALAPGVRPVLGALHNQISSLLVNLGRQVAQLLGNGELRDALAAIEQLERTTGETEIELALLESDLAESKGTVEGQLRRRREALLQQVCGASENRAQAFRRLFELTLGRATEIKRSDAAHSLTDFEQLVEQYLRLAARRDGATTSDG